MKYHILITLFFGFLLINNLLAQKIIEGQIVDLASQEGVIGVNIYDKNTFIGSTSDVQGYFELKIKELPTTIVFSYIGYEQIELELLTLPNKPLQIELIPAISTLPAIEVTATPKIEKLTKKTITIKDFAFYQDYIVLLQYTGLMSANKLALTDFDGQTLFTLPLKGIKQIESLHKSCLGGIHIITKKMVYEVKIRDPELTIIKSFDRSVFEKTLLPCVAASERFIYLKEGKHRDQVLLYKTLSKQNGKEAGFIYVANESNMRRMGEELGHYANLESSFTGAVSVTPDGQRPEHLDAWIDVFYKPVYAPLVNLGKELCLFNHLLGELQFYKFDGAKKHNISITYQNEKNWDKKILYDEITKRTYTLFETSMGKSIQEIDLMTGALGPAIDFKCLFVDKMLIYGNSLFYLESGPLASERNRILHKIKLF